MVRSRRRVRYNGRECDIIGRSMQTMKITKGKVGEHSIKVKPNEHRCRCTGFIFQGLASRGPDSWTTNEKQMTDTRLVRLDHFPVWQVD